MTGYSITVVRDVEDVVLLMILCFGTSCLSLFIQKCMEPGMILRRYYLWLTYHWIKNWRKRDRWKRYFLKPLGLCIWCSGTWIGIFFFSLYCGFRLEIFLFIGVQYIMTLTLVKTLKIDL